MAAGALIRNHVGDVLIVKPTYRDHWLIPGGVVDADESPKAACAREVREELGIEVSVGKLLCVEYRTGRGEHTESLQFVFDGGSLDPSQTAQIDPPRDEIAEYGFVSLDRAVQLLHPALSRRITAILQTRNAHVTLYMEDGKVV